MTAQTDASEAHTAYRDVRFFGSLDGLRCFCILLVLWHHRPQILPENVEVPLILTRGFTGVDFFFVLSGFLITTLLVREETRNGQFSIVGFYRRRILRIVPVYFLLVTLCAIWWIGVRGQTEWLDYVPYYFLFLANFLDGDIPLLSPTWSLSVEEQYYMIWPALLLLLPALRWRVPLLLVLIPVMYAVGQGLIPQLSLLTTRLADIAVPSETYGGLLIGSLVALSLHHSAGFAVFWRILGHRAAPLVAFIALLVAWQFLPATLSGWPNLVMHSLMAAFLVTLVLREDNILAPLLRWRPVARVGAISYGIYLWHLIGLHIGNEVAAAAGFDGVAAARFAMPVYLLASVAISEASFRWFESHFLKLKARPQRPRPSGV
jgi:peptidoglycan/LPS O-acetylase OafA/YrhL